MRLPPRCPRLGLLAAALAAALTPAPAAAGVAFLGVATLPGDASDLSGLKGELGDGTPRDRLGGLGSAIAYAGAGSRYVLASDRGPKDGATDYACRFHTVEITVAVGEGPAVRARLVSTTLLTDEKGRPFVGAADALDPEEPARSLRLDPEGVRVGRGGGVFISDEYGPFVYEFDRGGKRVRSVAVPRRFLPARPGRTAKAELPPENASGRQPNRGMEGLAISPGGGRLLGAMQSPLLQDGALDGGGKRVGVNTRLVELDLKGGKSRELVYRLDRPENGVNEVLAVSDREYLVLERDGKAGAEARFKKVFKIDLGGATDVSGTDALPADGLPDGVKAVTKALFLDLLDPRHKLAGPDCPEKFEGLAFGPDLPDGRRLLLVTTDNDFVAAEPTRIYAFAVDADDLPGYRPQEFDPAK